MLKIHKASAGSGKTYTLAKEYLRLLLGYTADDGRQRLRPASAYGFGRHKAHGAILAVTFTNKATEEMIQRIVKELYNLSRQGQPGAPQSNYAAEFCRLFGTTAGQLAAAASRALADLLFNFSYFNVSTLDSFFQTIVRTFARDLDLPENYNLEISQEYPVASSVADMFADLNRPEAAADTPDTAPGATSRTNARMRRHLEATIERFMLQEAAEGRGAQLLSRSSGVFANVVAFINSLINETYKLHRHQMEQYLADPDRITAFARALADKAAQARDDARRAAETIVGLGADKLIRASVLKFCTALVEGARPDRLPADITKALAGEISPLKNPKTKADAATCQVVQGTVEAAIEAMRPLQTAFFFDYLRRNIYLLSLFGHATRSLGQYCLENETFLLADTNDLLRDLIDEAEAPFIYDRIGSRIEHYLIDEFQDTSRMQWDNLFPLVLESLAKGNDNLIIGDQKQCIYRFRNSDPELLGHLAADSVAARFGSAAVAPHGHTIDENTNWRSARNIVLFNNTLYRSLAQITEAASGGNGITEATYAGLVQQIATKNLDCENAGYVKIKFFHPDDPDYDTLTLTSLTAEIERQLHAGYTPGQIAVLVRDKESGKKIIEHLLQRVGQPDWPFGPMRIVSTDSLKISSNPSVKTIINLLRLVVTPETVADLTHADADGNPARVTNSEWLRRRIIHRYNLALYDSAEPRTPAQALAIALDDTMTPPVADPARLMNCPNLFELVERLIGETLTPIARERDNAFITALQDLVLDYQDTGHNDIESFLAWWDTTGASRTLSAPEGLDALTVMTIHKAKGLEFPCVHIPYMHRTMNYVDANSRAWYTLDPAALPGIDPDLIPPIMPLAQKAENRLYPAVAAQFEATVAEQRLDALNVAYVATTRAVDELCVYARRDTKESSERLGERIYQALMRATPEMVDADPLAKWLTPLAGLFTTPETDPEAENQPATHQLFEMGHPTAPAAKTDASSPEKTDTPAADTQNRPATRPPLAAYDVAERGELSVDIDPEGTPRDRGTFMHNVLAGVRHRSDLPHALRRLAYRRHIPADEQADALATLSQALDDPRVAPWFDGFTRVVSERPASTAPGVRRPDRVVWHPDGSVSVIDYKFGQHTSRRYHRQVSDYMALLRSRGETNVRGYLWYPLKGEIIPVTHTAPRGKQPQKP